MPLSFSKKINNHSEIIVWNLTENYQFIIEKLNFSKKEKEKISKFTQKKIREYLGVRYVLKNWNKEAEIFYQTKGAPGLKNFPEFKISISHSYDKIALLISKYEVGVDIEKFRKNQILRIEKKFLRKDENGFIEEKIKAQQLQIIWGIKESLYKITKGKFVNFLENYKVCSFDLHQKKIECKLIGDDFESKFWAHYSLVDDYFLVYIINYKNERVD